MDAVKIRKIIWAMMALLIEVFVVLAFAQPLLIIEVPGSATVVNRYLVNIIGGGEITSGYGLADSMSGVLLAALMGIPPTILVSKKGKPCLLFGDRPFFRGNRRLPLCPCIYR